MNASFLLTYPTAHLNRVRYPTFADGGDVLSQEMSRSAPASHSDVSDNALLRATACGGALKSPGLTGWRASYPEARYSPVTSDDTASVTEAQKVAGRDYFLLEENAPEADEDDEAMLEEDF